MDLSVIMINFNTRRLAAQAAESVLRTVQDASFEIIVVDNSDQPTEFYSSDDSRIKVLERVENNGFGHACNLGAEKAEGEYLLFLNSDTIVHENALDSSLRYMREHPDIGILGIRTLLADGSFDHGCKRVAFIGGENYLDIVKRRKHGYLEALRSHHIPIDRSLVICQKLEFESGCQATEQLLALDNPPDGILAMNDTLAFSAMEVIRRHQLRIPADISLIGYTDELHSNYVFPKLTSVCLQPQEMGRAAFELLLEKIQGKQKVRQVVVPALLQVRDSTKKG